MSSNGDYICKRYPPQPIHGHGGVHVSQLDMRYPLVDPAEHSCGEFKQGTA